MCLASPKRECPWLECMNPPVMFVQCTVHNRGTASLLYDVHSVIDNGSASTLVNDPTTALCKKKVNG